MKKFFSLFLTFVMSFVLIFGAFSFRSFAEEDPVVIVIDPGHGGEGDTNLGACYNGFTEKEITFQLANALKAELEKFDNVRVYLTRTTDTFVGLEDRAQIAKNYGADFVFSIHFNASADHIFYGSEVWTSTFGSYYQKGYNFGQIVSGEWSALGLYQKGVKTRIGKSGDDYYGIIRHCVARSMPCVILEHSYIDNMTDVSLLKSDNFIGRLAAADATAIAKYYRLKSTLTGVDYSGYSYNSVAIPSGRLYQDETGPDVLDIKVSAFDTSSGNVLVDMTTSDRQSPVIYFSYSYDGGNTFSPLQMWDRTKETQSFNVKVPSGYVNPVIVTRAYNSYEKGSQSLPFALTATFSY